MYIGLYLALLGCTRLFLPALVCNGLYWAVLVVQVIMVVQVVQVVHVTLVVQVVQVVQVV